MFRFFFVSFVRPYVCFNRFRCKRSWVHHHWRYTISKYLFWIHFVYMRYGSTNWLHSMRTRMHIMIYDARRYWNIGNGQLERQNTPHFNRNRIAELLRWLILGNMQLLPQMKMWLKRDLKMEWARSSRIANCLLEAISRLDLNIVCRHTQKHGNVPVPTLHVSNHKQPHFLRCLTSWHVVRVRWQACRLRTLWNYNRNHH